MNASYQIRADFGTRLPSHKPPRAAGAWRAEGRVRFVGTRWLQALLDEQLVEGGTSIAGLRSKKPGGVSEKPQYLTGITGESSGRGTWVNPKLCQTTMSVFSIDRFCGTHTGKPAGPAIFWQSCWSGSALLRSGCPRLAVGTKEAQCPRQRA